MAALAFFQVIQYNVRDGNRRFFERALQNGRETKRFLWELLRRIS